MPFCLDGELPDGPSGSGAAWAPPPVQSLSGLAADARQKGEALARLEARLAEVERQLAKLSHPPSTVVVPPADVVSVEEGRSSSVISCATPPKEQDREREFLECSIQATVWDAPAIIGLPAVGSGASATLCVSMILNGCLQIYICFILLTSDKFTNVRPWEDQADNAHSWRVHVAHEASQIDGTGTSLASRVCGGDESLSVATSQFNTLAGINAYLGLQPSQLEPRGFGTGPLLCSVCILIFVVLVLRELRCIAALLRALAALPRGHTRLEDSIFAALSNTRLLCVLLVSAVRACVALVLLYAGVVWLAATTSITELILNAAALGFVMELDEVIYETVVPAAVHTFVAKLKPLAYPRPPRSIDALLPLVAMFALVSVSLWLLLVPNIEDMVAVKKALCGGNLDFVIKQNIAGFVVARATVPFGAESGRQDARADLRSLAVSELLDFQNNPNRTEVTQYSLRKYTWEEFEMDADLTIREWADSATCADLDKAYNGILVEDMPTWFTAIRETTGLHRGLSLEEKPWNCSEYADAGFCHSNALMRLICPISCGCTDPRSGLLFGQPSQGCPRSCVPLLERASAGLPCEDVDDGSEGWRTYWQEYAGFTSRIVPHMRATYEAFTAKKIAVGCDESTRDPIIATLLCDSRVPFLKRRGLRSIAAFCPAQCCQGPDPDPLCPRSCPR